LWCAFASLFGFHFYLRLWARMGTMEWVMVKQQESEDKARAQAKRAQETRAAAVAKKHVKAAEKTGSSNAKRGGSSSSSTSSSNGKVGVEKTFPPVEGASSKKGLVKSASRGDSTSEIALTQLPA